ncbi:MAG: hypothetical protein FIB07_16975 [Candidatus Methanoperedens sp.]|nr:hypothetical protein [Candidatus Methanoperedens sp.]
MATLINQLILFGLIFGLGDVLTTYYFIKRGGKERNPGVRWILKKFGFTGLIVGKIIAILMISLYVDNISLIRLAIMLSIIVCIYNLFPEKMSRKQGILLLISLWAVILPFMEFTLNW